MEIDDSKIFQVKFNTPLKLERNYNEDILISRYVDGTDIFNGIMTKVDPNNPSILYVAPSEHWEKGTFYLTIKKGLPEKSGRVLIRDTKLKFIVN
ncbi:hypothetical protein [Sporosarcina sp. A2]|uniref:hypothetical protein n=1 Tax=Sporosarcina sp. A2 TaxID=3393449 RepID=UPI003D79C7CD